MHVESISEPLTPGLVLFDEDCPPCRLLAELAGRRAGKAARFLSWQAAQKNPTVAGDLPTDLLGSAADKLRVWADGAMLESEDAWAWLLAQHPDLAALGWLADKLGLRRQSATVFDRTGQMLRRLCPRCYPSGTRLLAASRERRERERSG